MVLDKVNNITDVKELSIKVSDKVEIYDLKINNICENISKILKLEIFSVDLIKIQDEYYVIDVNPSSAFYLSNKARLEFIKINKK